MAKKLSRLWVSPEFYKGFKMQKVSNGFKSDFEFSKDLAKELWGEEENNEKKKKYRFSF